MVDNGETEDNSVSTDVDSEDGIKITDADGNEVIK